MERLSLMVARVGGESIGALGTGGGLWLSTKGMAVVPEWHSPPEAQSTFRQGSFHLLEL